MARIEKSVEIGVLQDKVWPMLFWDRIPEWLTAVKTPEYRSHDKDRVGATAHVIGDTVGTRAEFDVEIA